MDRLISALGIGGGNRVRFAGITNDLRYFNGHTGMSAVMGSKNSSQCGAPHRKVRRSCKCTSPLPN